MLRLLATVEQGSWAWCGGWMDLFMSDAHLSAS
jgi:hypothetical protein